MNLPILRPDFNGQPFTMSSREIAELCEKRHNHVLRDIEKMIQDIDQPKFGLVDFSHEYKDAKGEMRKEYRLPKDLTVTLVTGYRADLRYRVVKRLEELEAQSVPQLPNFADPAAAARAWADEVEQKKALALENHQQAEQIAELAPEAEEYRAYISLDGVCSFEQFCNKHGVKKNHPGQLLRDKLMLQQKKLMATLKGTRSGVLKNVQDKDSFHYVDSKGNQVEAQRAYIVTAKEAMLLEWLVDAYGRTAFRSLPDFERAKGLIGGVS